MEKKLNRPKKLFKKKKYRRYFRYFLLCITIFILSLQLIFVDKNKFWEFDNIAPISTNALIILFLLIVSVRNKRYRARKRAIKRAMKRKKRALDRSTSLRGG